MTASKNVFAQFQDQAWPFKFNVTLDIDYIAGGTPYDQHVAEGWLKTKLGNDNEKAIQELVAETMAEMGQTLEEATETVNKRKHVNGFKRDENGLYIEGRQVKAAIKEAVSVAVAAGKLDQRGWGTTRKSLGPFVAEHIVVDNDKIYLGCFEPTRTVQRFVHTFRGTGIQYEEIVDDVAIDFTVLCDWDFDPETWAMIWLTGGQQGLGAARSQGYGRYIVSRWDQVGVGAKGARVVGASVPNPRTPAAKKPAVRKAAA